MQALSSIVLLLSSSFATHALDLSVVGPDGTPVTAYRWLIEEDATYHSVPGQIDPRTLAVSFHRSYMPVFATGDEQTSPASVVLDPLKHYYISVLPASGYTIGGAPVAPGQTSATVTLNELPLPTAQISILVFEDTAPLNNAPNLPEERPLEGFTVVLSEAGGRYGMSGGQVMLDAFGNPLPVIKTDANGEALIKNLSPGKYGIQIIPPAGQGWQQTNTIEGTKTIDAWVKPNEPPYFVEFGPPGWHVTFGFVRPTHDATVLSGGSTISGTVVNQHMARPPASAFYAGAPFAHTTPWIGLNDMAAGRGRCVYANAANEDGSFSITGVPPGSYQLAIWDNNLDLIFASLPVTVPAGGGAINLGNVPVFQWFTRLEHQVFYDGNENGFRDAGEVGIPEQLVNLRFRDGSMYQSMATDTTGFVPFDEVFPFFNWLVAEVDYTRFKATGVTSVVDNGGPVDPSDPYSFGGQLNPQQQLQPDGSTKPYRTETGPQLLQAFQGFLGQTSVMMWGKKAYGPGENGGISGVIYYASTRAENDPRYAVADPWEPGIPRVPVVLYQDANNDNLIDDLNNDGFVTLADIDQHPFGNFPSAEDVDHNGNSILDFGDALQVVTSDSWDDSPPAGAFAEPFLHHGVLTDAYDGLRNFNQVRPGVFDGGYAFTSYFPGGMSSGSAEVAGIPNGFYIVQAAIPRGYEIVKEEDKNVDFGDSYTPSPLLLPAPCVGDGHIVPPYLTLFPGELIEAPFANTNRPQCDRKQVILSSGQNAAADFHLFTKVPVAGHIVGMILDDTANEFDPNSPQFGEKYAPPWMPISIRDWTGREISRVYSDEWGKYNALVPSTYTANRPMPSGYAPNMLTVSLNDPGPISDPNNPGSFITDPFFNRQYSQFSYTFQYMPGTTTYLDTPVLPVAAFAGPNQFPVDCELPTQTPEILSVSGPLGGPHVALAGERITITALGTVNVPNPAYAGSTGIEPATIARDYGFGASAGSVTIGGQALENVSWSDGAISGDVAAGTQTGQLVITRADSGRVSVNSVTVTVGGPAPVRVAPGGSIQTAIDTASPGDLILIPPGTYDEMVIMWKPVKLQGWGAASTIINAAKIPAEKLQVWRNKIQALIATNSFDLLPPQQAEVAAGLGIEPVTLFNEEGAGILVLAKNASPLAGGYGLVGGEPNARIDGLTIQGADHSGAVVINGYAHDLQIGNNRITNNQGIFGGAIRAGHPTLTTLTPGAAEYQSAFNDHLNIHHNAIVLNSTLQGAGGAVALYTGSDNYSVSRNFICGNLSLGEGGGGIGHQGLSEAGVISENQIIFNESFNQGQTIAGGGILISGAPALTIGGLSPGAGSVTIDGNLIQGNNAGSGDGGGIAAQLINGRDAALSPSSFTSWHRLSIVNNIVVNNVAALAGAGISLQDAARTVISHNTIANNDSTGTAGLAFPPGSPNLSQAQPSGIVSRAHSPSLAGVLNNGGLAAQYGVFSNPEALTNNIVWHNRSFRFTADPAQNPPFYGLLPDVANGGVPVYWDLGVLGAQQAALDPQYCTLTSTAGYSGTNTSSDPLFVASHVNGDRGTSVTLPEITTAIQAPPAFDEGGNFIRVRYGPLTLLGNYHLSANSPAIDAGAENVNPAIAALSGDFDREFRPSGAEVDIGADEVSGGIAIAVAGSRPNGPSISGATPNNTAPVALNDSVRTARNTSMVIKVLANDYDSNGAIIPGTIRITKTPNRGGRAIVVKKGGVIKYTPKRGFKGTERFSYKVRDNAGMTSKDATVTVRVR